METLVYTVGLITILLGFLVGLFLLGGKALELYSHRAHAKRVQAARKEGWEEPRLPSNWSIIGDAATQGVVGVEATPDPGVPVSDYAAHAARVQRKVELAWLDGIEFEKMKTKREIEKGA